MRTRTRAHTGTTVNGDGACAPVWIPNGRCRWVRIIFGTSTEKKCLEMYTSGGTGRDDGSVDVGRICRSILVTITDFFVNIEKIPSKVYLIIYSLRPLIT